MRAREVATNAGRARGRLAIAAVSVTATLAMVGVPAAHAVAPSSGYNVATCRPSVAHPDPVVLVHGLGADGQENWAVIGPMLAANGYCAFSLTYGVNPAFGPMFANVGGILPMQQSAQQLAVFVQQVLTSTGASKVDIVGHSEGSLMPDWYVKFLGGSQYVDRYIGMTPLWAGANPLGLASLASAGEGVGLTQPIEALISAGCQSCTSFLPGSAFLTALAANGGPAVPGVTYTMLMTSHDELVAPYTSGYLNAPNATNIVVQNQCALDLSGHVGMALDTIVEQDILNALDPATAQPPRCTPQLVVF